jgi:hypothetical protein
VVAVGRDEDVLLAQGADRADVSGLLSRGEMAVAADPRRLVLALGRRLEGPDEQHQLEQAPQLRLVATAVGRMRLVRLRRVVRMLHLPVFPHSASVPARRRCGTVDRASGLVIRATGAGPAQTARVQPRYA